MYKSNKISIKLCSKNINRYRSIYGNHLKIGEIITINIEELEKGSNIKIEMICDKCGIEKSICYCDYNKYNSDKKGEYYCNKCKAESIKLGCLKKYGVENVFQLEETKEKSKITCNEKYGCDYSLQNKDILQKQKNTNNKKYGVNFIPQLKKYSLEGFIEKCKKVHGDLYDYSKVIYQSVTEKIVIICKKHGEFNQLAEDHLKGIGCPICNTSKGEQKIKEYLDSKYIMFIHQKKFDDCIYKNKLPFDFYLLDSNICIEYDGEQHFKAVESWGGEKEFELRKIKDNIKTKYCLDNGIKLVRIKYSDDIVNRLNIMFEL